MADTYTATLHAHRCALIHSLGDPSNVGIDHSFQYFADGLLVIDAGHIIAVGDAQTLLASLPTDTPIIEHSDSLLCPGFIDIHTHYPQTAMIASYGEQLLDWLENYTFPSEQHFYDKAYATSVAEVFINELLRNGTTTALVFGTVHAESVDAFFQAAEKHNLRMISGKVMMDRNAPDYLTDTPASSYHDSKALIERWHGKGRLHYAVTPRFAPTSSREQLALAGKLLNEYPDVYLHTHLAENTKEIEWVNQLFPERSNYLDVYDHYQLLGERSVFAHSLHLCDSQCQRLKDTHSAIAFCPSSNLFLGSGLFDLPKMESFNIKVGVGTDIGAGTSFSMLQTLNEAYKVMQLQQHSLNPFKSLYLATLGGAQALTLESKIGNFQAGKEADFVILDYKATPLINYRIQQAKNIEERLFVILTLGDDRAIKETFAMGRSVYRRDDRQ